MLTKSLLKQQRMFAAQLRAFSSIPEYDVAVIGGGPGGKYPTFIV